MRLVIIWDHYRTEEEEEEVDNLDWEVEDHLAAVLQDSALLVGKKAEVKMIGLILRGHITTVEAMTHMLKKLRLFKHLSRMRRKNQSCSSNLRR